IHVGITGMKAQVNVAPSGMIEPTPEWSLTAYPNPADNFINLKAEGMNGKMNVCVLDLLGAEVVPAVTVEASTHRINLVTLAQGTYFIRIENGDRTKVIRFMKK
ncbi:MAG: T9SS type A sorting domain-containing protein, partial [Flavobacteriales bacterium]